MDASTTPQMYNIFCMVEGDESLFAVYIKETLTVGNLKDEIFKKIPFTLKEVETRHLKLYKTEIKLSEDEAHIEEVNKQFKLLSDVDKGLKTWNELSEVFKPLGPLKDNIHILVRLPPGESIDPKVGGAIAETKRPHIVPSTTPTLNVCAISTPVTTNSSQAERLNGN